MLDAFHEDLWGGTGGSFDWRLVPQRMTKPIILSGGLTAGNVASAIRRIRPYAVDVSSSVEASKGIKDAAKIAAFIGAVKHEDA
jgi:phosphoribosylanthranilate isomerase